ncbi:MAG: hypothetical protein DI586_00225 [Micavibrio aeruginosavorus]|uniref:Uncharacterized protein n=1 Tax=Micavibrio aeruginosavorus TaxID=349221 RepID=A0A2W5HH17_9BACT|nr:MAG: hypothetical protein DI586_00225 [Micavibrio aeruginosavorus]
MSKFGKSLAALFLMADASSASAQTYWTKLRSECAAASEMPDGKKSQSRFSITFLADEYWNVKSLELRGTISPELERINRFCFDGSLRCADQFRKGVYYYRTQVGRVEMDTTNGLYKGYIRDDETGIETKVTDGFCQTYFVKNEIH